MKNFSEEVVFLSGQGNHPLGSDMLKELTELSGQKCSFDHINISSHPDGENDNKIPKWEKIAGKTVVYYSSLNSQTLLNEAVDIIYAANHQYGAKYTIAVVPFLLNRRQDPVMEILENDKWSKKIPKPWEIQRLRQTIHLLSFAGVNELVVATPHSVEMEKACNDYGIKFHAVDPSLLFAQKAEALIPEEDFPLVNVYAPDAGSIPRAVTLARILHCKVLFHIKFRAANNITSIVNESPEEIERWENEFRSRYNYKEIYYAFPEKLEDAVIVMVDDEVTTGKTANDTGNKLRQSGVKLLYLFIVHAVLTFGWRTLLFNNRPFTAVIMANSIRRGYDKLTGGDIVNIDLSTMFGSKLFKILNRL